MSISSIAPHIKNTGIMYKRKEELIRNIIIAIVRILRKEKPTFIIKYATGNIINAVITRAFELILSL
jgi:hypothetical protein